MDFFDVVTTQRAMRRLKPDAIPDDVVRRIMDAAICAPSGGNRQNWSFLVVRDPAKRARLGELYREAWGELMKVPYYASASKEPASSPAGKMLASARHLGEHLGEAPVIVLACVALDPGVKASVTTGASIYPAVQNIMLAARALGIGSCITTIHRFRDAQVKELLGIPAEIETAALIPLGYPLGKFGRPPRRPLSEVAFADRWGRAL
ncbi:MAG TPA: nitroreductase family protein [Methylomirabilota bacterium]|jgi:nitroreductase|nr:nitroreductase family protein [Methylomirabilota bacterium]